jgi:sulfate permease, SulP family
VGEIVDYKQFLGSKVGWVPALRWIPAYTTRRFGLDLIAGLSLAAFVIPESLAYASLAQLPPVTGLHCYLVAGIVYALFGTSGELAVGPTSGLAIMLASSVAAMGGDDPSRAVAIGSSVALMNDMRCRPVCRARQRRLLHFRPRAHWVQDRSGALHRLDFTLSSRCG